MNTFQSNIEKDRFIATGKGLSYGKYSRMSQKYHRDLRKVRRIEIHNLKQTWQKVRVFLHNQYCADLKVPVAHGTYLVQLVHYLYTSLDGDSTKFTKPFQHNTNIRSVRFHVNPIIINMCSIHCGLLLHCTSNFHKYRYSMLNLEHLPLLHVGKEKL